MSEDAPYLKSSISHLYLFGYELPDTLLLLSQAGVLSILSTAKKVSYLQQLVDGRPDGAKVEVVLYTKTKEDKNAANFSRLVEATSLSPSDKIACITKEGPHTTEGGHTTPNSVCDLWQQHLKAPPLSLEFVDLAPGLSAVMAIKDKVEQDLMKKAAVLTKKVFKHFRTTMEDAIEEEVSSISTKYKGQKGQKGKRSTKNLQKKYKSQKPKFPIPNPHPNPHFRNPSPTKPSRPSATKQLETRPSWASRSQAPMSSPLTSL